jgi:hypothetical protein
MDEGENRYALIPIYQTLKRENRKQQQVSILKL